MIPTLIAFPFLGLLMVIQTAVGSRLPLLHGTADLVLLALVAWALQERVSTAWQWALVGGFMVSLVSALPSMAPLWGYLIATGLARLLQKHVWQAPVLAMFVCTFVGTLAVHGLSLFLLQAQGVELPFEQSLNLVTLPSALLNLILAIPMYTVIHDMASWLYPQPVDA